MDGNPLLMRFNKSPLPLFVIFLYIPPNATLTIVVNAVFVSRAVSSVVPMTQHFLQTRAEGRRGSWHDGELSKADPDGRSDVGVTHEESGTRGRWVGSSPFQGPYLEASQPLRDQQGRHCRRLLPKCVSSPPDPDTDACERTETCTSSTQSSHDTVSTWTWAPNSELWSWLIKIYLMEYGAFNIIAYFSDTVCIFMLKLDITQRNCVHYVQSMFPRIVCCSFA